VILSLLVAVSDNGVIGQDNDLPWHLPKDLQWFKRLTVGRTVIMGRKTFESIGRPLPNRRTIVLTRNDAFRPEGVDTARTIDKAMALAESEAEVFVVGGAAVYHLAFPRAQRLYLTRVRANIEGDVQFPEWHPEEWRLVWEEAHEADDRHACAFVFQQFDRVVTPPGS
jgi:dihydrofolate reductase